MIDRADPSIMNQKPGADDVGEAAARGEARDSWTWIDPLSAMVMTAVGLLPWRTMLALGGGAGRLGGRLLRVKRKRITAQLALAGVTDPRRRTGDACSHLGRTLLEMAWLLSQPADRIARLFEVEQLEVLRRAAGRGRGVVVASGHLGNWELACQAIGRSGLPFAVVARPLRSRWLERRVVEFRSRGGVRTLVLGRAGASLAAYRWLARGRVLGCLVDRPRDSRRIRVPFLSRTSHISLGPAEMACRAGAAVVLVVARRGADGRTRVSFSHVTDDPGQDPKALAAEIARKLERAVLDAPDQWFWVYRRSSAWRPDIVEDEADQADEGAASPP